MRVPCTCVLECLFPPVHPSFRSCRVAPFVRACVRVDVRHSPPPTPPSRSVVSRLLALRRPAARQHAQTKWAAPLFAYWHRLEGVTARDPWPPGVRDPRTASAVGYTPHTPTARRSVPTASRLIALDFVPHRCGEQLFDAERVDGHQVLRKEEKDAKSAAQLHLLHSCLGTPTEQVGVEHALHVDGTACACACTCAQTLLFATCTCTCTCTCACAQTFCHACTHSTWTWTWTCDGHMEHARAHAYTVHVLLAYLLLLDRLLTM